MEDDSVMTLFRYRQEHQSYPGRVHGGLIHRHARRAGLPRLLGVRAEVLAVTMELQTKYRRPVPYDEPLKGVGTILSASSRFVKSHAQITDMDGHVLAEAEMKYIKLPSDKVTDADYHEEMCYALPDDVKAL